MTYAEGTTAVHGLNLENLRKEELAQSQQPFTFGAFAREHHTTNDTVSSQQWRQYVFLYGVIFVDG